MVAIKFNEDRFFNNEIYSKIGGISCRELNNLEKEIFVMLDHKLLVDPDVYHKYESIMHETYTNITSPS